MQQLIDNLIHGETKTLIWTQPRPTSKLLCFRRQWWATPQAEPTIADESIMILMLVEAESKEVFFFLMY